MKLFNQATDIQVYKVKRGNFGRWWISERTILLSNYSTSQYRALSHSIETLTLFDFVCKSLLSNTDVEIPPLNRWNSPALPYGSLVTYLDPAVPCKYSIRLHRGSIPGLWGKSCS